MAYYLQKFNFFCAMQHYGWNGTLTNLLPMSWNGTSPVRSISGISGLKMAIFGLVRVGECFIKIFCNWDEKLITWRGGPGSGC